MSGVHHQPDGPAFDIVLILHVGCVVVGLATLVASAATAARLRTLLGGRCPLPEAVARYFRPGVNWAGRTVYGIPRLRLRPAGPEPRGLLAARRLGHGRAGHLRRRRPGGRGRAVAGRAQAPGLAGRRRRGGGPAGGVRCCATPRRWWLGGHRGRSCSSCSARCSWWRSREHAAVRQAPGHAGRRLDEGAGLVDGSPPGPARAAGRRAARPSPPLSVLRPASCRRRRARPAGRPARPARARRCSASRARSHEARAGLAPPVETAMVTGPSRCTDGRMNEQCATSSALLTHTPAASASA